MGSPVECLNNPIIRVWPRHDTFQHTSLFHSRHTNDYRPRHRVIHSPRTLRENLTSHSTTGKGGVVNLKFRPRTTSGRKAGDRKKQIQTHEIIRGCATYREPTLLAFCTYPPTDHISRCIRGTKTECKERRSLKPLCFDRKDGLVGSSKAGGDALLVHGHEDNVWGQSGICDGQRVPLQNSSD